MSVVTEEQCGWFFVGCALVAGTGFDVVAADVSSVGTDRADFALGVRDGFDVGFCQVRLLEGFEAVLGEQILFQSIFSGPRPCRVGGAVNSRGDDGFQIAVRDTGGKQFAYQPGEVPRGAVCCCPALAQGTFEAFALFAYHDVAERFPPVPVAQSQRERYLGIEAVRHGAQVGPAGRVTFVGGEEVHQ